MVKYNLIIVDRDIDDLEGFWNEYKDKTYNNTAYIFITNVMKGNDILNSKPKWFRYDLILRYKESYKVILLFSKPSSNKKIYNPQKIKGEPYIRKNKSSVLEGVYGKVIKGGIRTSDGYRHPTSILDNNIDIYKWCIGSYTNEGDDILILK